MTTPTTQREADERKNAEAAYLALPESIGASFFDKFLLGYQAGRAAIDQSTRQAAPAGSAAKAIIDHIADNWPMKKYSLEEIEDRLRAEFSAATDQPSAGQVDERAAFESYIGQRAGCELRNADGSYQVSDVQKAWSIWQARASLTPTAPTELITYTVDGVVMSQLEYIDYLHGQLATPTAPQAASQQADTAIRLLREAHAALETWKDVAPAVSLCADIEKFLAPQAATTATCQPSTLTGQPDATICQPAATTASACAPALTEYLKENFALGQAQAEFHAGYIIANKVGAPAPSREAAPLDVREALQLMVDRFGPCEDQYIFSKRTAIQKARAALARAPLPGTDKG